MARAVEGPGADGERLTRDEAFDLVKRAVESLVRNDNSVRASDVRSRARELLGRDSESLSERNFIRILKDAHDAEVVDLRRRGDDFEVARAEPMPTVGDQLALAQSAMSPTPKADASPARLSLRGRGSGPRGRMPAALPPELLSLGVVQPAIAQPASENGAEDSAPASPAPTPPAKRGRKRGAKTAPAAESSTESPRGAKRPRRARAKKSAKSSEG
jgi:hypothetical protein